MRTILISLVVGLLVGAAAVRQFYPRTQTVEKEVVRTDIKTVTVVERPDGTHETVTIIDHTTKTENKNTISAPIPPQWLVTGGAGLSNSGTAYSIGVQKRLLGPAFVGLQAITSLGNTTGLITLGLEF